MRSRDNDMSWKKIIEDRLPQHLWFGAHGCALHAHQWVNSPSYTLVLVHGAIANNVWWQHIACQLTEGQILSIDLSGHGLSSWDTSYTLTKHAQEVEVLIEEFASGPVYIIGHSYGGAVAALVAANCDIKHSVMLDTPLYIALDHNDPSPKSYHKYLYQSTEEAISRFKPIPNQPVVDEELLKIVAESSLKKIDEGYVWQFDPSFHKRDISEEDQELIKPMLHNMSYWYGEFSPFATDKTLRRAKSMGLTLTMVPNAYHAVTLDNPSALLHMIEGMVEK
jgi:pimeloyl-ACP methyl ester carboxylesterase